MNCHRLDVEIFQMALEGTDVGKVWQRYRSDSSVERMLGDAICNPDTRRPDAGRFRKVVDQIARKGIDAAAECERTPFIAAAVKLKYRTLELASAVITAMDNLSLTNPREIRNAVAIYQKVHQDPGEPVLQQAVDMLEQHEAATEEINQLMAEVFPPQNTDDDE